MAMTYFAKRTECMAGTVLKPVLKSLALGRYKQTKTTSFLDVINFSYLLPVVYLNINSVMLFFCWSSDILNICKRPSLS